MASAAVVSKQFARDAVDQVVRPAVDKVADGRTLAAVRGWVVSLFVKAIASCSVEEDRLAAVMWLATARETLADGSLNAPGKARKIYAMTDSRRLAEGAFRGLSEAYGNYRNADMPLAVKIAIPVTVGAGAILGGPAVGIAGFGSAIGVPILLVVFLGVAGITSILEAVLGSSEARDYVSIVAAMIARDEMLRRVSHAMKKAMSEDIVSPHRKTCGEGDEEVRAMLLGMDPYAFERHVMSFFVDAGLLAWATRKSNDAGVDGFARHANGLIVVQCKRNAEDHGVGRPLLQQFKGVVEENDAWRGYVVTTGYFTREAQESAAKNARVVLVDLAQLIEWHRSGIATASFN
jgi:HJR/Mrr/RecB family endonuclease